MIYTSINNPKIKDIKKLTVKKYRDLSDCFLIEGKHLVTEAYKKGYLKTIIVLEDEQINTDIDTIYVNDKVMKYLSNLNTPSKVMGICKKLESKDLGKKIVILDDIQDPGNLGTIIRSCVAFNVDSLILSNDTVDIYNDKVLRSTGGLIFNLNIVKKDLEPFILDLKKNNYKIYVTKVTKNNKLKKIMDDKFAIVMGNEGMGVSNKISLLADDFIHIEMNDTCESLNVGVACSIILYELSR